MLVGDDDASGGTVTFMVWNVGLGATVVDCAADCPASEPHPATAVASSEIATKQWLWQPACPAISTPVHPLCFMQNLAGEQRDEIVYVKERNRTLVHLPCQIYNLPPNIESRSFTSVRRYRLPASPKPAPRHLLSAEPASLKITGQPRRSS